MHWIARHILKRLAFDDSIRYAELLPQGVEGNLFQYHARALERAGLIARSKNGYSLTAEGRLYVADLSRAKGMRQRALARPMVAVVARDEEGRWGADGQWLLFRWRRWPMRGLVGLPSGRWLAGWNAMEMAADQLVKKTGYAGSLSHAGTASVMTANAHTVTQIFEARELEPAGEPDGATGSWFWGMPASVPAAEAAPGFAEIIAWLENRNRPTLFEVVVDESMGAK